MKSIILNTHKNFTGLMNNWLNEPNKLLFSFMYFYPKNVQNILIFYFITWFLVRSTFFYHFSFMQKLQVLKTCLWFAYTYFLYFLVFLVLWILNAILSNLLYVYYMMTMSYMYVLYCTVWLHWICKKLFF